MSLYIAALVCFAGFFTAIYACWQARIAVMNLKRKNNELTKTLKLRGRLAHEVAHELRNPITAILCSAETLDHLVGPSLDETNRRCLSYIRSYGDNILRLVNDFIDISRGDVGMLGNQPKVVDMSSTVRGVVGLLESSASRKKLELRVCETESGLQTYVDPKNLKQIVFNLVHNALKFTRDGGIIEVIIRKDEISSRVVVEVRDTGVGIEPERLPSIFDPYVERQTRTAESGLGLGLSLSKRLTEAAGGTLSVTSAVGVGTTFILSLPLSADKKPLISEENELGALQPLKGQSFLLVDPDNGAREAVCKLLEALGGVVKSVAESTEAVSAVAQHKFNAIMVDESIDDYHGIELAQALRRELDGQPTRVVVAACSSSPESRTRIEGTDDVVEKPLNGRALLQTLLQTH